MPKENQILLEEVKKLLHGGNAHAGLDDALAGLPPELRGAIPEKLPYSIWQLLEHIRIAQWDMLGFCKNPEHESPKWPEDYWVKETAPKNEAEWNESIRQIEADRKAFIELMETRDIYAKLPHGSGQRILTEALQIADHNAYHIAEIIVIRRLLGAWN